MKRPGIIIILGIFAIKLLAQSPGYLHFSLDDGLPSNLVYCAWHDKEGYMWFGTDKGLSRFDGVRFKNYSTEHGLPDPEVLNLFEDFEGKLWIGCFHPKLVYRKNGQFITENQDTTLREFAFWRQSFEYFQSSDSLIWISGGLGMVAFPDGKMKPLPTGISAVSYRMIDSALIGIRGQQIFQIDPKNLNVLREFHLKSSGWAVTNTVHNNRIIYAFPDSTYIFEFKDNQFELIASTEMAFQKTAVDRKGNFWGCLPGKGAVCFKNNRGDFSNPVWYLEGKKISNIYEDKNGNIWFMTTDEGLFMLSPDQANTWQKKDGLFSSQIISLAEGVNGEIYAGDDLGNVYHFQNGKKTKITSFGNKDGSNLVRHIAPFDVESYWAVTDEGFFRVTKNETHILNQEVILQTGKIRPTSSPKAIARTDEKIWVGTGSYAGIINEPQNNVEMLWPGRVTAMSSDLNNYVWKGGTEGLFCLQDTQKRNWGDIFPCLSKRIIAICPGMKDQLWVVTPEHGLIDVRTSGETVIKATPVNQHLKRPIKNIKNVRTTPEGNIWLATNKGVYYLDQQLRLSQYTTLNGLANNEVNDILIVSDTLWAATVSGLTLIKIKSPKTDQPFITLLSDIQYQIADSTVEIDWSGRQRGSIFFRLNDQGRMLQIMMSGISANVGDIFHYQHIRSEKLLTFPWYTFDNLTHWLWGKTDTIYLESANLSFGANLKPGRFLMQSSALTLEGRIAQPVFWEFEVLPHWSQTIWIRILIFGLIGAAIWRFFKLQSGVFLLQNAITQHKLQSLRAQINPHFVGNSINAIQKFFYPPDPEKASEYIHLFTALLRKTLYFSEKDFILLSEEMEYVTQYLQMIQLRYSGQFEYHIALEEHIPPDTPFPAMLLQPLLENATIHGLSGKGMSHLTLYIQSNGESLHCTLSDNGPGIKTTQAYKKLFPQQRRSKGIELLEQKVAMLNRIYHADIRLEWQDLSEDGTLSSGAQTGTRVHLSYALLPLKSQTLTVSHD